ncbi:MAG: TonB-dependent receptor [Bacteroidales bacterium]|nr:TonB-dependent receptor [Bacteroidales bacterium]
MINKSLLPVYFLFIIFFIPSLTNAQTEDTTGVHQMFTMEFDNFLTQEIITAARKSEKLAMASANAIVINRTQIEQRGYTNLIELLNDIPGFDLSIGQPAGEYPSHFYFRGISDVGQTNVLILIDGVIQNDVAMGWARGLGFELPMIDIKRVEVISGPGSALYGANAYAGIVHIITQDKKANNSPHLDARISYGANKTIAPELAFNYKLKNGIKIQLAGRWYYTPGDEGLNRYDPGNYFHNNYEPDSVLTTEHGWIVNERNPDGTRKRISDGFNTSVNNYGIHLNISHNKLRIGAYYWNRFEGLGSYVPGYEYFTNEPSLDYLAHHSGLNFYTQYITDITNKIKSTTLSSFRNTSINPQTGFYYTYKYQSVDNGIDPAVSDKKKSYYAQGFSTRIEQQFDWDISNSNTLTLGIHLEHQTRQHFGISLGQEQDNNTSTVNSTYTSEQTTVQPVYYTLNYSVFAQEEILFNEKLKLNAGVRLDHDEFYGNEINPRLAIISQASDKFYMKLFYGQAYKAPTIFTLHDEWRGNTELQPQEISTYELEFDYIIIDHLQLKVNTYYNHMSNMIVEAQNPDPSQFLIGPNGEKSTFFQNIGSSGIYGATVYGNYFINHAFGMNFNYAYTIGEGFEEMDNISLHKVNFAINYNLKDKVNFNLRANYRGKIKAPETNYYFHKMTEERINEVGYEYITEENPDGYLDGFFLLNITISGFNLFKGFDLQPQIIINNVLNKKYVTMGRQSGSGLRPIDELQPSVFNPKGFIPAYHPQAGREFYLKLIYKL